MRRILEGEALISMWIPKVVTFIRGRCLFQAQRLLEEIRYVDEMPLILSLLENEVPLQVLCKKT